MGLVTFGLARSQIREIFSILSETDFTQDLKRFDVPILLLHGEDDQVVPVGNTARKSEKLIKDVKAIYYPGAPHGITATHMDQVNADLFGVLGEGPQELQSG